MFWKRATHSHIDRLTLITSITVGVILAVVFVGIYRLTYSHTLGEVESGLMNAARFLTVTPSELNDPQEFHVEHPDKSMTLFTSQGLISKQEGTLDLAAIPGIHEGSDYISVGVPFQGGLLVVGTPSKDAERGLERLAWILSTIWFPLIALVAYTTNRAARSTFAPLSKLAAQASAISGSDLSQRLESQDRAEFGQLALQLNEMLGRLEEGAHREEQFASDAAHELRTPLAILRTRIETTLLNERKPEDYRIALKRLLDEVERLSVTAESLLSTTRARTTSPQKEDLLPIVKECFLHWDPLLKQQGKKLMLRAEPCSVKILPEEVRIILDNLLENAGRYSGSAASITIDLGPKEGPVVLRVTDNGPGVEAELAERIFDRFVRGEASRNLATGGIGIGLALVRRLVEARGGHIVYELTEEGPSFVCRWPAA